MESALASFIEHSERMIAAIHEDVAEMRAHGARTDSRLLELRQQGEKDREASNRRMDDFGQRMDAFSRRADEFNRRMDEFAQRAEVERRAFNKRWAELSDSMGTLIEDMVAPCGFQLAKAIFGGEEAQTCTIRVKRRHPLVPGEMMELDLLAVSPTKLLVVEVKRRMDAAKAAEYQEKIRRLPEFFPEFVGKALCPAVASVYIEPSVVAFLNRERLYGIAMGDEVMEVINLGQFTGPALRDPSTRPPAA